MPSITTITLLDGNSDPVPLRVVDVSGVGSGPFVWLHGLADKDGVAHSEANPIFTESIDSRPAKSAKRLTFEMISDTVNLADAPRAMRIFNGLATKLTLSVLVGDDTVPVPITVPESSSSYELLKVRRIRVTGSSNLISGSAIATGVEVLLLL